MIKTELVSMIAEENPHLRIKDAEHLVNTVFEEIIQAMEHGRRVELRGFGSFSVKPRDRRKGRNPRTGELVDVDAKSVPFFKAGKEIRARLQKAAISSGAIPDTTGKS